MVEKFTTNEIISQASFCDSFEKELRDGVEGSVATEVFSINEVGEKGWTDLMARIIEHNIRMMAKYYTKIRLARMAKLLALTEAQTEDCLSEMVVAGTVSAKTDGLEGIIGFIEQRDPLKNLNVKTISNDYFLLCTDLVCLARFPLKENCLLHCPQGYLTPSCTALLC